MDTAAAMGVPGWRGFKLAWGISTNGFGSESRENLSGLWSISPANFTDTLYPTKPKSRRGPGLPATWPQNASLWHWDKDTSSLILGNLSRHLEVVEQSLVGTMAKEYGGLAVLDYESPRPLWDKYENEWEAVQVPYRQRARELAGAAHSTWSTEQIEAASRTAYEAALKMWMLATLGAVRRHAPRALAGFYGFPERYTEPPFCETAERGRLTDQLVWMFNASSAIFPSVYLLYEGGVEVPVEFNAAYIRSNVAAAVRVAQKSQPVWAYSMFYYHTSKLHKESSQHNVSGQGHGDLREEFLGAYQAGAAGTVIWGNDADRGADTRSEIWAEQLHMVAKDFFVEQCNCSSTMCQRKGKCVLDLHTDEYTCRPFESDDSSPKNELPESAIDNSDVSGTPTLRFESVTKVGSRWSATDCHNGDCRYDPTHSIAFDPMHILVQANVSVFGSTDGGKNFALVSRQWHHGLGNPSVPEPRDGDVLCNFMTADFGSAGVNIVHPHTTFTSNSGFQWCVNLTSQRFTNKSLTSGKYSQATYTGLPYRTTQFPVNAGGVTKLTDGSYVSLVPVWFVPTKANNTVPVPAGPCCNNSVVAFRSDDAKHWSFLSFVAQKVDMDWPSEEGPNECDITLLKDNRTLFAVMRTDGGDSEPHHYHRSYATSLSTDHGHSWSRAKLLPLGMGAAFPRATTLADGTIVISGGRSPPGRLAAGPLNVWASFDGYGKTWGAFGIPAAHNHLMVDTGERFCEAYVHATSSTGWEESSCYTSISSLGFDASSQAVALVCYERQGSGSGGYVHNIQPKACQHDHSTVYCMRLSVARAL